MLHTFFLRDVLCLFAKMTHTQREGKETLRRRASTPIPASHQPGMRGRDPPVDPHHPPLGQSASYHPGDKSLHCRANWSSDDSDNDSDGSGAECLYRVVLLGDHGVGKSSLANIFAGIQEKDAHDHTGGGFFTKHNSNDYYNAIYGVFSLPSQLLGRFFCQSLISNLKAIPFLLVKIHGH